MAHHTKASARSLGSGRRAYSAAHLPVADDVDWIHNEIDMPDIQIDPVVTPPASFMDQYRDDHQDMGEPLQQDPPCLFSYGWR